MKNRNIIFIGIVLFGLFLAACNRPIPSGLVPAGNQETPSEDSLASTRTALSGQIMATLTSVVASPEAPVVSEPESSAAPPTAITEVPISTEPGSNPNLPTSISEAPTLISPPTILAGSPTTSLPERVTFTPMLLETKQPSTVYVTEVAVVTTPAPAVVFENPSAGEFVTGAPDVYYLHKGEFPWCLARRYNIDPRQLMSFNGFFQGQVFYAGQPVYFPWNPFPFPGQRALRPHPDTHTVWHRETIYSIACYYGDIDPIELASLNGIIAPYRLTAGQVLLLP